MGLLCKRLHKIHLPAFEAFDEAEYHGEPYGWPVDYGSICLPVVDTMFLLPTMDI
jgi:hypothetical protein